MIVLIRRMLEVLVFTSEFKSHWYSQIYTDIDWKLLDIHCTALLNHFTTTVQSYCVPLYPTVRPTLQNCISLYPNVRPTEQHCTSLYIALYQTVHSHCTPLYPTEQHCIPLDIVWHLLTSTGHPHYLTIKPLYIHCTEQLCPDLPHWTALYSTKQHCTPVYIFHI